MAVCFTEPLSEVLSEEAAEDQGNKEENHYPNPRRFFQASRQAESPLPTRRSGRQRPHVQSRGGSPGPLRRALIQASGCPPNRNQTKRSRGGRSDVAPWLLFVRVYKQSFFLLCYLLFSRLRNIAQDLIWVSLFKCPNPCKGLVSGCVHFAQY